jgi:anti-sigma factor RsiW
MRESLPTLAVLAPQAHTGLTVQEQPVLYWYLSQETRHPVEVILTDQQRVKPLLAIRFDPPLQPGMQRVRLADYNVRLTPGVLYTWSVSLIRDAAQRSYDVLTAGTIERVELPEALRGQLVYADTMSAARLYATEGLWYDTIAALSELIDTRPQDTALRQQRATVLEQEGLTAAAAYDRQRQ